MRIPDSNFFIARLTVSLLIRGSTGNPFPISGVAYGRFAQVSLTLGYLSEKIIGTPTHDNLVLKLPHELQSVLQMAGIELVIPLEQFIEIQQIRSLGRSRHKLAPDMSLDDALGAEKDVDT
jgi:hypothetical protein